MMNEKFMKNNLEQKEGGGEKEMNFEQIARENFETWNKALLSKDPEMVASLYSDDNTFLPTLSPDFKSGKEGAKEYFEHFLEKNPEGEIVQDKVQVLSDNTYLHSGMYNFTVGKDQREVVEARFSYVWRKNDDGQWQIIHHHSSVRPK